MTLSQKLSELETHYTYWVGAYKRKELNTNNVRISAECICKAAILFKKGDGPGTTIIFGKDVVPEERKSDLGQQLSFVDLIEALIDLSIIKRDRSIHLELLLIRDKTNPSSHSSNRHADNTTLDDLEVCNTNLNSIIKWLYSDLLRRPVPPVILNGIEGKEDISAMTFLNEKWNEFITACHEFDYRRYQYILVVPEKVSDDPFVVESLINIKWRLILDFNPRTDENETGLLYNFNKKIGQGYKKAFTLKDKIEFDPDFRTYWFLANGQADVAPLPNFKAWRPQYKTFLSDKLYQAFNKGSRVKSRVVVLLDIDPLFAEHIISEFNRIDEANLSFVLCSEKESYDALFQKENNIAVQKISAIDLFHGISKLNLNLEPAAETSILIPLREENKYAQITQDHYDYLYSLGIEVVYKGIENSIPMDDENAFYRGSTITWRDLAEQRDLDREALQNIEKRLKGNLQENKLTEIKLIHEAGAGGTTLARRIAYNCSFHHPTVVIRKYLHKKTIDGLRLIYDQYTKGSLPLLILVESFEVKESPSLFRDLSNAKKNAVILIIHRGSILKAADKKFILRSQLDSREILAFESSYARLAPGAKSKIKNIVKEFRTDPKYINPVLYALTAFGKDYNGLDNYIAKCLEGATFEQKQMTGFICLIYYYTQKSVPAEVFSALFKVDRSKCDLIKLLSEDNPLFELLHQNGNEHDYLNTWRPRYALLGDEAMMTLLAGGSEHKKNWRNQLGQWLIELIRFVKLAIPNLDDETLELFNAIFIERSYLDEGTDKEFTSAMSDLTSSSDGVAVFEALTEAYPNEAHFHGHFARYLYSGKIGIKDYDKAIKEAETSLEISPENASLLHTLGMCYREKTETLIYNYEQQGISKEEAEDEVKKLTEIACEIFDECIEKDSSSIYGHESQIRVILRTLEFGSKIHHASTKESFITNPVNTWYAEKLDKVSRLLEDAFFVIEQSKKIENQDRIQKSASYINDCEGLFFKTLGQHQVAKSKFEDLIKSTPKRQEYLRPHYRRMFVMCLLAAKSKNQRDLFNAWQGISEPELNQCVQYLNENIIEDPNNTHNIRLWLQAIRHLKNPPDLVSCISKISAWTQVAAQNKNSLLEGYYYLYVLHSIKSISDGNKFDQTAVQTVKDIQEKMRPFIKNEKFCYEWFGKGHQIGQMVNHRTLGEYTSTFFDRNKHALIEVSGRIKEVNSSQQGLIVLDCGLEAFFVPNVGGFTERNNRDKIKCYIGFRYDQMQAWSVTLHDTDREKDAILKRQEAIELHGYIDDARTANLFPDASADQTPKVERIERQTLSGPKILGYIKLDDHKKVKINVKKPEENKVYSGKIKALKGAIGFIIVSEIDKNVTFGG